MNYKVKVEDQIFEVEIQDIYSRPIVAVVDGVQIEVWPEENRSAVRPPTSAKPKPIATNGTAAVPSTSQVAVAVGNPLHVLAPIPGTIQEVLVEVGSPVSKGQVLFILEAMKMKNTIRANRDGLVAKLHTRPGKTVKHHDLLLEYEE